MPGVPIGLGDHVHQDRCNVTSLRSSGHHGTEPTASSASTSIVASECAHARWYSPTISLARLLGSRPHVRVRLGAIVQPRQRLVEWSAEGLAEIAQPPRWPRASPVPAGWYRSAPLGGGCRTPRARRASRAAPRGRPAGNDEGPLSDRIHACPTACHRDAPHSGAGTEAASQAVSRPGSCADRSAAPVSKRGVLGRAVGKPRGRVPLPPAPACVRSRASIDTRQRG